MSKSKFNKGKLYHGSESVCGGKLKGETCLTDYFYFLCPKCEGKQIMRALEYEVRDHTQENKYNEFFKHKAIEGFTLAFHIHCEKCGLDDFTKISNIGLQSGDVREQQ
jgi:predicted RNA-binding Zn-ribbon protein involved in translation (DUF1610 family)